MHKRSLLRKTAQVGSMTLLSRFFGIIREILLIRFLGVGALSDAFLTAWRLPNFFRKIFAEGALSAAFIPVFVKMVRSKKRQEANGLMTISFLFFEGILLAMCLAVILFPRTVIWYIAPGFSVQQVEYTIPLLQILFPFIFFISSSALLAGALQSVHHFFIPAFSQPILNIFWISSLLLCLYKGYSVYFLSVGILLGGFTQLLLHVALYWAKGFAFGGIGQQAREAFKNVLEKFVPCLLGASVMEANLFLDTIIASYLTAGSMSILYYGNRFMQIPIGIFAIALSTTLLPHFSRVVLYAPKRMNFYVLELVKFVSWAILPAVFFLMFEAEKIFYIFLMGKKGSAEHVPVAKAILIIYTVGLLFFCINKVFTSIFYAYRDTWAPSFGFALSSVINFIGNVIGIYFFGIYGIAASTVFSGITLTTFFFFALKRRHNVSFFAQRYLFFLLRYVAHGVLGILLFLALRFGAFSVLEGSASYHFYTMEWGYWLVEFPLFGSAMLFLFLTKNWFGVRLYFLD